MKETDKKISRILDAVMEGKFHTSLDQKLKELEDEKRRLEYNIEKTKSNHEAKINRQTIKAYLATHQSVSCKTFEEQKRIDNSFVESVVVYNEHIEINMVVSVCDGGEGN